MSHVTIAQSANSLSHLESLGRHLDIFKMTSFEEALINNFRTYPVLYDMSSRDYKNEKLKANVWEKIAE